MKIFIYLLIVLICRNNASPAREGYYNLVDYLYDDIDDNNIVGSQTIDVSDLGPEAYGLPKNESGDALANWSESSLMNPEEVGGYEQGDILMPPQQGRNGVREEVLRWPQGHIPYVIEGYFNSEQRETIMKAIADYHRLTCLRFVPYNGQKDYIVIQSQNTGCWSSVGKIGGRQEVNLQSPGCVSKKGTVLHELLHAIGFMHEQSRPERDDFVWVRYNNIRPGSENNFKKASAKSTNDFNIPYDYNSVMHYSEYAFSKNQEKTIEPKVGGVKLGQREGLSRGDVKKVNNMYNCKKDWGRPPHRYPSHGYYTRPRLHPLPPVYPQPWPAYHGYQGYQGYHGYDRYHYYSTRHQREPQTGWLGGIFQNLFGSKSR